MSSFAQLEVIETMPHLRILNLARCPIPVAKWNSLSQVRSLHELNVSFTSFDDCFLLAGVASGARTDFTDHPAASSQESNAIPEREVTMIPPNQGATNNERNGGANASDASMQRTTFDAPVPVEVQMSQLERLDLDGCPIAVLNNGAVVGLYGLSNLKHLKYLSVRQVSPLPDCAFNVPSIDTLDVQVPSISDLSSLAGCVGLRYLYVDQNQVPPHQLHHIRSLLPKLHVHITQ